jgi:aspartate racemase
MTQTITIGVLGGIGPEATGKFYLRLIRLLQQSGELQSNKDYPRIVINSIPAPELVGGTITATQLVPYLEGIRALNREEPSFIVLVCNTIHLRLAELQAASHAPIMSLPAEVRKRLPRGAILGILGTVATAESSLFRYPGIKTIQPSLSEQTALETIIIDYIRGDTKHQLLPRTRNIAQTRRGATHLLLACTELSLILGDQPLPIIDTIDILAHATATEFLRRRSIG